MIKPIKNLNDFEKYKKHIESVNKNDLTNTELDELEILEVLVEDYERKFSTSHCDIISEPIIDNIYDLVKKVSKLEQKGILERGLKLGEEYGELSAEILKMKGYKKTSDDENIIKNNILLESTDCLIMIFDIMTQMDFNKEEICDMANKQVNKWLKKYEKTII